jgi:transglutaminase-like putative cysteine protease
MTGLRWPGTTVISLVAALTTWVTLLAWSGFSEQPSGYLVPLVAVCLLVAAVGAGLRTTRLPAVVVLLVQVLAVGLWLHQRWTTTGALAGWLPTATSLLELQDVLAASTAAAQSYSAPVPRSVPEFPPVMVAAGAATALVVDFLACGLRRAPLAGLPLLAAYTAPVSILGGGVSWLAFGLAALMFLALITCQEATRLGHWGMRVSSGRVEDPHSGSTSSSQAVWSSARKIGLSATGLAIVVPLVVPTLGFRPFEGGSGFGGAGDSMTLSNPIADLRRDLARGEDTDWVQIVTADPDPSYLRTTVLDTFDGDTWRPSQRDIPVTQRAEGLVPRPPGLDAAVDRVTRPWRVQLTGDFASKWLPVPYPVFSINAPGDWRYDRDTLDFFDTADDTNSAGLRYDLEAIDVRPTPEQLDNAGAAPSDVFGPGTELPEEVSDRVRDLAREVTDGTQSPYDEAVALQEWFRVGGGFEYSLDTAPGNGLEALDEFLSPEGRVGYCEQFAAAMALMGRSLAIPSRVAVGFLRPEEIADDTYVYSAHDLHAWPEMYFDGIGWVRFEPTPGVRTGAVPTYTVPRDEPSQEPTQATSSAQAPQSLNRIDEPTASADEAAGGGGGGGVDPGRVAGGLGAVLVVVALALAPRLVRSGVRRRRLAGARGPAELAELAWDELRDSALDLGLAWSDRVSVRVRARELSRSLGVPGTDTDAMGRASLRGPDANPEATAALERLVHRVELARYARPGAAEQPPDEQTIAEVRRDLDLCLAALTAGAAARQRRRATWLPASLWSRDRSSRPRRSWGRGGAVPVAADGPVVDRAV